MHVTRHCPTEYGKDIVAIDPHGRLCAFQLKGGSSFSLNDWRKINGQIVDLVNLSLTHPSIKENTNYSQHRTILVLNGRIEEEVQIAIRLFNENQVNSGF